MAHLALRVLLIPAARVGYGPGYWSRNCRTYDLADTGAAFRLTREGGFCRRARDFTLASQHVSDAVPGAVGADRSRVGECLVDQLLSAAR
jgi:hypothetical protein